MDVAYSARSHVGRVRDKNEDNLFADGVTLTSETRERPFAIDGSSRAPVILAVCDGMGGENDGEIASLTAVSLLAQYSERIKSCSPAEFERGAQAYVSAANKAIRSGNPACRVGTTLALAIVAESGVYCFSIGDTRIYSLTEGALAQVTNDHTLAAEKVRSGLITAERARLEKDRHKLTRCIGIGETRAAESYPPIRGKCRILICSDGLTDMVSRAEIEDALKSSVKTAAAADYLLKSALDNGGRDNVTIVVADAAIPRIAFIHGIANKFGKRRKV
ncbi:MAG: protein phosphatase 2C domain-containing protein [Clostridiales bacterium]|jgi:protein phosphatase|nr:protein phosphatase 2C domain-containing protein [Clostridiales bacterium]